MAFNGWLQSDVFSTGIKVLPLVSIDFLILDRECKTYLFGWRNNRPAAHYWFVPGGRVRKNESLDDAFIRLTTAEIGKSVERSDAKWVGVYEHFYDDSTFGEGESTHYIVLTYEITFNIKHLRLPLEQHSKYQWMTKAEILKSKSVHQYSKDYFK